jgi:hypothetical protein
VPFAFVRTRYARFCGVQICPAGVGLMRYFTGVALMPTGPTSAVIPRGKSSTNWGLTPSVMILNVTGMSLAPVGQVICHGSILTSPIPLTMIAQRRVCF